MTDEPVLMECKSGLAVITLNRPEVHNAFDEHLIASLSGKLSVLALEDDIRAIILRGTGKSFSAGGDLAWMQRAADYTLEQNQADAMSLAGMLHKLYTMPKLTIACVQGAAMGGGMGLAACCDIVLSTADAFFALSEVKLGLIPATISPYVLRAIGERSYRRYALTAERISADKAHEIGLVHEVYADADAMQKGLDAILDVVRFNGPMAMAGSKKLAIDLADQPVTDRLITDTATRIAQTRVGDEAKEGLDAFLQKRKPAWARRH